eukprot:CAMPEP_0183483594 /NCGR_PEP_ID=MMETSP0370-20130417/178493_1 /TAXON_ID=268820 /ORGANISM="Peridinium aciculiferum, Strain PAER-2" /LENGTH=404 /DNA_ID=CAMNT_0025676867 /DNA_START=73 /DNA_END=1284 /DNA_ORIENTATION=-
MVQQSRLASAVALLTGAASAAAAVTFVGSPNSATAPRAPRLGLASLGSAVEFEPFAGESEPEAQEATSSWKWLAAGLAAGIVAAASSAPAEAKLPTGPEWDLATTAKAPWLQPCKDNKKYRVWPTHSVHTLPRKGSFSAMVQQSRLASAVALLAGAASAAAAVNFVTSPSSVAAPRAPRLGLSALGSAADDFAPMAGEQPEVEAQEAISPLKWLAAGLCAGVIFAASSALVEAKLPTGPEWDLATKAKAPWLQPCKDNKKYHKKFKDAIYKLQTRQKKYKGSLASAVKDNKKYHKKFKDAIYKLQTRQKKYTTGGVIAKRFDLEIAQTKRVEEAYGNRLCGKADGTPRTIASGENVRGSIVIPGLMFLYIAGWIGWAGRSYLNRTKSAEKEMFIEIPLALTCMA